jgi:hypothetical protein
MVMGGRVEGLECADPGSRTTIRVGEHVYNWLG